MDAIGWDSIELALWTWVQQSSGFDDQHVIWGYTAGPRPAEPYIELEITEVDTVGGFDWRVKSDAPNPQTPGQEVHVYTRGHRTAVLQMQCFGANGSGNAPLRVLSNVMAQLPLQTYAIDRAGAGIGKVEKILGASSKRSSLLLPRALTKVHLHVASEVEWYTTFVERAQVTTTVKNEADQQIASVTTWTTIA